jgi:acyl-CoA reductase-like NAD-dependent aldehyde dehydrogenase
VTAYWKYDSLFVDGAWVPSDVDDVIEVIDPATEDVIGSVPNTGLKVARTAIEAARKAFDDRIDRDRATDHGRRRADREASAARARRQERVDHPG